MKKILLLLLAFAFYSAKAQQPNSQTATTQASNSANNPAAQLAHRIADKMKDSLGLSNQQRAKVFQINMDIFKEKGEARGKSQDRGIVGKDLQKIEGTRDSRYKEVLTTQQYTAYLTKKRNLVNNQ